MVTPWIPPTLFGLTSLRIAVRFHDGATVRVVRKALRRLRFVDTAHPRLTQRKPGALTHGPRKASRVC